MRVQETSGGTATSWNSWPSLLRSLREVWVCTFGRSVVETWHDKKGQVGGREPEAEGDAHKSTSTRASQQIEGMKILFASRIADSEVMNEEHEKDGRTAAE